MSKKKPKRNRNRDPLPKTITVSVSTTFTVKDLIEDIIQEQYPYWGEDIVDHMNDVLIDEILDWCVHQAQETLQEEVEDYRNLVLTDEHGQLLYTHIKKKSKKSKKKGKTKK